MSTAVRLLSPLYQSLPREVVWAINCKRLAAEWRQANVIFVHVPKAAGTSVSTVLYGRHMGHLGARTIKKHAASEYNSLYKFALVRNPWDRLYSAYHFAKVGGSEKVPMRHPEQYTVPAFASFHAFVYEWLAGKDLTKLDFVFMPQSFFVLDESGKVLVDDVFKVEALAECKHALSERLGRAIEIPAINCMQRDVGYREA